MTAIPLGQSAVPHVPGPTAWALGRAETVRLVAAACAGMYALALGLPWIRANLGAPLSAGDLPLYLPGLGRPFGATWSAVVIVLAVTHAGVVAVPARYQAMAARTAAALSVTALGAFLLLGAFADRAMGQRLLNGQEALDTVRRIVGYRIPRPSVTTLGPLELPSGAAAFASALRAGSLLALVAGGLSVGLWLLTRRGAAGVRPAAVGRAVWVPRIVVATLGIVVLVMAVQTWRAVWLYDRAAEQLTEGRLAAARADVTEAIALNDTLQAAPEVQQLLGDLATATGIDPAARQFYGRSLLAEDAGRFDDALDFAARAAEEASWEQSYEDNVCRQATALASSAPGVDVVRSLVPVTRRCDLTLLQLAASELAAGRYDLVSVDAAQLSRQTPDEDVRSAALTMLARARLTAGDLGEGRTLLQQALADDPDDLNVVARALASGLYSANRQ
jgi:tetratricopeptide (TPR) repeat protein